MSKYTRYQVLWDAEKPKTGVEHLDVETMSEVESLILKLEKEGKRNVRVWDMRHNPISEMFRL